MIEDPESVNFVKFFNMFMLVCLLNFFFIVSEVLFKTISGQSSTRMMMESLGQSQHVMLNVINACGAILNIVAEAHIHL